MSYPALPDHQHASSLRGWHLAAGGAVIAVLLQLWGLYRVTGPPQPSWIPYADKLVHAIGFAVGRAAPTAGLAVAPFRH